MATITNTNPPVLGTTIQTWEGYVRADELLPGDVPFPGTRVDNTVRLDNGMFEIVIDGVSDLYHADETVHIERTVTVTIDSEFC